jgi:molecular chaperone IbpA
MRTHYDFAPLWRSTIGFDRLFDLVDAAQQAGEDNYPPCNVERLGEDRYQISLAVAGFLPDEIAITAEQSVLTVEGRKAEKQQREFLYQGISSRPFKRLFNLADYVQVKGAAFDNGLLQTELARDSRGDETTQDCHRGFVRFERPADRRQSGRLIAPLHFHIPTSAAISSAAEVA